MGRRALHIGYRALMIFHCFGHEDVHLTHRSVVRRKRHFVFTHSQSHSYGVGYIISIGVARILSGVHFFCQKVDDLLLVVVLKERLNIPPNLSHPAKTVLKLTLTLAKVCTSCPGGALTHFSCKLGLKKFFTALGV